MGESTTKDVEAMSVKELKALIASAGLSAVGLAEKSELRERAREAVARLAVGQQERKTQQHAWSPRYEYVNGGERECELAVILMHGIGASSDDLVPLASSLAEGLRGAGAVFVFPGAPNGQWWPFPPQFMSAIAGGEQALAKLIRTEFPGLENCRSLGASLITEVRTRHPKAKIVLGGFSQGAMTSTDIAMHSPVDAILHLSGAPIDVENWAKRLQNGSLKKKPLVYISHGKQDFVLPFFASQWTKLLFEQANCDVTYRPHDGMHTIGPLEPIAGFLIKTLFNSSS